VLDIAVTPDRGYALSVRGVARETATAFGLELRDPGLVPVPDAGPDGHPVRVDAPDGCDRYVARVARGLDPAAQSPPWLQRRLVLAGMRPISLAVDVTNHVMLELGQPLHAFDLDALSGDVVVRRATPGERLTTLDGQDRALDPEDLLITDDRGPIALAGVMGGGPTEVTEGTTSLLVESAHFTPRSIARTARRHRLPSEASRRYERGVDPALAPAAAEAAVRLLVELGGATAGPVTDVDTRSRHRSSPCRSASRSGSPAGRTPRRSSAAARGLRLHGVRRTRRAGGRAPSWRPDLTGSRSWWRRSCGSRATTPSPSCCRPRRPGAASRPSSACAAPRPVARDERARRGRAAAVRQRRRARGPGRGHDAPRLVNPLSAEESLLRPTLLPGPARRGDAQREPRVGGRRVFETGHVLRRRGRLGDPHPGVDGRPTAEQRAALDAALPAQPRHLGLALAGRAGLLGRGRVGRRRGRPRARACGSSRRAAAHGPFHPGRTAELLLDGRRVGLAGELHPRVVASLGPAARDVRRRGDLDLLVAAAAERGPLPAPLVSHFPPASVDVALVVADDVPAADVERALRDGAGALLEGLRLFDVFRGPQVGEGRRSLAFALRLRAPDRTLTDVEVLGARDAAVAVAADRTGAVLRGT
jgi:phenylalanyl-tRNA synthetase beta chain